MVIVKEDILLLARPIIGNVVLLDFLCDVVRFWPVGAPIASSGMLSVSEKKPTGTKNSLFPRKVSREA